MTEQSRPPRPTEPAPDEQTGTLGRDMRANVTTDRATSADEIPSPGAARNPDGNVTRPDPDALMGDAPQADI